MNIDTIPCALKKRIELRASEDLSSISEQCTMSGWRNAKSLEAFHTVLQDSREGLSSLMTKMLVIENNNTRCSSLKTPLSAWQVCLSAKQHQGGYQLDPGKELFATKRPVTFGKNAHLFTPPRCFRSNVTKENSDEVSCVERDVVKEARAKSASHVDQNNGHFQDGGKLTRNARSASSSSHTGLKFCHSKYTDYYIKSYREQITNDSIRKHIQWRLKENNSVKKPVKKTHEVKSKTIPKPSFTFYRFRISKNKSPCDNGYLKVGPCPRMLEQKESKKAGEENKCNAANQNGKGKRQTDMAPSAGERKAEQKRKEIKSVTTLKFQNTLPPQRENSVPGVDIEGNAKDLTKTESREGKLKKVELRVHKSSSDSPRIVPKTGRVNKTKVRSSSPIASHHFVVVLF